MSSISQFIHNLYSWICSWWYILVIHCIFCFFLKLKLLSFTCSHLFYYFVFNCCSTRCHSLSLAVSLFVTRRHSLYHSLFILCHSLYHSLSLDVPLPFYLFINDLKMLIIQKHILQIILHLLCTILSYY